LDFFRLSDNSGLPEKASALVEFPGFGPTPLHTTLESLALRLWFIDT
jgi:hypothetical protein